MHGPPSRNVVAHEVLEIIAVKLGTKDDMEAKGIKGNGDKFTDV